MNFSLQFNLKFEINSMNCENFKFEKLNSIPHLINGNMFIIKTEPSKDTQWLIVILSWTKQKSPSTASLKFHYWNFSIENSGEG